jgi:hypothetical protein
MYSNPFRCPISSLGLPIFLLRIAERERWQKMPSMTIHPSDRTVTHNKSLRYFKAIYSFPTSHFFIYILTPDPLLYWNVQQAGVEEKGGSNRVVWSLLAGGASSLLFCWDKLTNHRLLTLSILKYLNKTNLFIC